jgi:ClpP class serine protease
MNEELKLWLGLDSDGDTYGRYIMGRTTQAVDRTADTPPPFQQIGNVAVIPVRGTMVNGFVDPLMSMLFGVTGYDNIRNAAISAAMNPDIVGTVYHYASTGGDAAGVEDLTRLLLQLRAAKPSVAFTDSFMASSAYWMGTTADRIIATNTATVGSIGVKMLLVSRSKALEAAGIDTKVIRYGDKKALGGPTEPLDAKVVDHYTQMAARMGVYFEQSVADNLGLTLAQVQKNFGNGAEFLGMDAVNIGMVHAIGGFETALASVRSSATSSQRISLPLSKGNQMKTALETIPPADDKTVTDLQAAGGEVLTQLQGELTTAKTELATAVAGLADANTQLTAIQASLSTVQTELATARTEAGTVVTERDTLKTDNVALAAQNTRLLGLVVESCKGMALALNTPFVATGFDAVMAAHAELSTIYSAKFRTSGGKLGASDPKPAPKAAIAAAPGNLFHLAVQSAASRQ